MYVHALHTVHALPDLRVAGGHLGTVCHLMWGRILKPRGFACAYVTLLMLVVGASGFERPQVPNSNPYQEQS